METTAEKGKLFLRNVYLYLVAIIALITGVIGAVGLIDNVLKNYVFQVNEFYYTEPYPANKGYGCEAQYADPTDSKKMITPTKEEVEKCKQVQKEQQEQQRKNNIGREFSISIAQLMIGIPLWLFHWSIIQKENKRKEEN